MDNPNYLINEELIQEKFRQILIRNKIAHDYVLVHEDDFVFKPNEITSVEGTINIFKDSYNNWLVWNVIERGENVNIRYFKNQIHAYIEAAERRNVTISLGDLLIDYNNTSDILETIQSAKSFLQVAINVYEVDNLSKLNERLLLLESFEKEFIKKQDIIDEKELTKKRIK